MIVSVCQAELYLSESQSLKDKRQALSSLKERLHNRFNLSVAEVDHHDLWQRACLGLAAVSNSTAHGDEVIAKAVDFIRNDRRVVLSDYSTWEA